ncbi:MAG: coenzyme F420-0:L-glutamate ligase [Candidatus Thorarchaeota archaeon]|jgi:coenzyme F420-0:L-glutamate ligase/coenzyme F420-1:gamma-L-glutamate ligase
MTPWLEVRNELDMTIRELSIVPIGEVPLIKPGDSLPSIFVRILRNKGLHFESSDVLIISHTIVSVAEEQLHLLSDIEVSERARNLADELGKEPEFIQLALSKAVEVIRERPVLITRTSHGLMTDYSGIDQSNAPPGYVISLPIDPDESAQAIHAAISKELGVKVPVIIADTQGRPWRKGAINLAIGIAGMSPFFENVGKLDRFERKLTSSRVCLADELAAAAELVMGQADEGIPAALVRGLHLKGKPQGSAKEILRDPNKDFFR